MLFDTVGPALLATLAPDEFQSTMGLTVSFLRPVRPGRITAAGRIVDSGFHAVPAGPAHGEGDADGAGVA
jgi:acyl-coenzyme A thioesterase PaaI-like protein